MAWACSGVLAVTPAALYHSEMIKGYPQCWIDMGIHQWRIYIILVATTLFFIPTIIITGCYVIIVITVWTNGDKLESEPVRATSRREVTGVSDRCSTGTFQKKSVKNHFAHASRKCISKLSRFSDMQRCIDTKTPKGLASLKTNSYQNIGTSQNTSKDVGFSCPNLRNCW